MRINVTSVFVDDQDKALKFYTEILGFIKKTEIPFGEARWLTVVSAEAPDGTELLLEPDGHPAVGPYKRALVDDGTTATSFAVDDVRAEYERLKALGVRFTQPPVAMGPAITAVFDDTCGTSHRSPGIRSASGRRGTRPESRRGFAGRMVGVLPIRPARSVRFALQGRRHSVKRSPME